MNLLILPGSDLTPTDLEGLAKSWIDDATARIAQLRRVNQAEGEELVGNKPTGSRTGICFPYVWPGEDRVRDFRIRRDSPEITIQSSPNGQERKEVRKYLAAPGSKNKLYFSPATRPEWLTDPDIPIVITEGEKKCLALWRLSWHAQPEAAELPRFVPIGLSGVWNWRGNIGREPLPDGGFAPVKGVIPDFDRIDWTGRRVVILFDANVRSNESVKNARAELAGHLVHQCKAEVYYVTLPKKDGVNGVDDLLGIDGPDKVLKLIENAREAKPGKQAATAQDDLLAEVEFLQTPDQQLYATVPVNGHRECWALRSRGFRSWIIRGLYARDGKMPTANALQETLNDCTGRADAQPPEAQVYHRIAGVDGSVYLDLANESWECVEITAAGWQIATEPPVRFRRARGMQPIPPPLPNGNLGDLRPFVNAEDDWVWILLMAWLLGSCAPTGPYPVLILQGEQGSAKSTTAKILRSLVDPAKPAIRSLPRDERDLVIGASNSWFYSLDNMSGTPQWLSDALCRLSTGGGFATRELHSDQEETLFEAERPIILNGIDEIAAQADLVDRSLIVTLPVIPENKRRPQQDFWSEFEEKRPRITGALLTAVSAALRYVDGVKLDTYPRMADFTRWVVAAARGGALPFTAEQFLEAYGENRQESVSSSIEGSPVAAALEKLVTDCGSWEGTPTELLERLNKETPESIQRLKAWPKDVRSIGNRVRRVAPLLRQAGIEITCGWSDRKTRRKILLENKKRVQNDVLERPHDEKSF